MAEPIQMPFGTWTLVGPRNHVLDGGAHWRHLANMTETYMCSSNAVKLPLVSFDCCLTDEHEKCVYSAHVSHIVILICVFFLFYIA